MAHEASPSVRRRSVGQAIAIIGVAMLVIALFLPLATATSTSRSSLASSSSSVAVSGLGMTNGDLADLSAIEFARIYGYMAANSAGSNAQIGALSVGVLAVMGVLALVALVAGLRRRPVPLGIFTLLSCGAYALFCQDLAERGVVRGSGWSGPSYDWGIAHAMLFAAFAVMLVGAVVLFVERRREKKRARSAAATA